MKRKLFSIVLSICMVFTMIPMAGGGVFAATATSVKIGGVELNADKPCYHNATDGKAAYADKDSEGANAEFNATTETLTLTLKNLALQGKIVADCDLNIVLVGNNTINSGSDNAIEAKRNLEISGNGSLTANNDTTSPKTTVYAEYDMTIKGGAKVEATKAGGAAQAIDADNGKIIISGNDTELTATNQGTSSDSNAIRANSGKGSITVSKGAKLEARQEGRGTTPAVCGKLLYDGDYTISATTLDGESNNALDGNNMGNYKMVSLVPAAAAEKTISKVDFICDIAKLGLDTANTEVDVDRLLSNAIDTTTEGVALDNDASLLMYKKSDDFVKAGEDSVTAGREYGIKFFVELSSGYQWLDQKNDTNIEFTLNGETNKLAKVTYNTGYNAYAVIFSIGYPTDSTTPSATASDVTVAGTTGVQVTEQEVTVSLKNDKFKEIAADTDVSSWFNLPVGLTAKVENVVAGGANSVVITISGTPTATCEAVIDITIPANILNSGKDLKVTANTNAKYNIVHVHNMEKTEAKAATSTQEGNNQYYKSKDCGKVFKDVAGETDTTVEKETLLAEGHSFEGDFISQGVEGHAKKCKNCDKYDKVKPHEFSGNTCTVCGYTKQSSGSHYKPVQKPVIEAGDGCKTELGINGTKVTITVEEGYELVDVLVNGISKGKVTELTGLKTGDKVEIKTEKIPEKLEPQAVKNIIKELKLVARSERLSNGNVRIRVTKITDINDNPVDLNELEKNGYTVKFKYYRSVKKSAGYDTRLEKDADINSYINNFGDKGTKYYYKVKVMVYDADGNLVAQSSLNQCKYAMRAWIK